MKRKPIDTEKLVLKSPLQRYRIRPSGADLSECLYVMANYIEAYGDILNVSREYLGHSELLCAYGKGEWERIELVSEFPEEEE